MSVIVLAAAIGLSGCFAEIGERLKTTVLRPATPTQGGEEIIIEPDGSEVIEETPPLGDHEHEPMCLVRARHFHGLVREPCEAIIQEGAP